jgi:peptidoglycan/LPS O-acetylase OafA/YrhL
MKQRIPQLDVVRGIAILIVMVHNASHNLLTLPFQGLWEYGWMGVDLFFVLSGFLITGILFDSKQTEGYFKNFYARRCLRIWPLYYSVLFLMFVVIPLLRPSIGALVIVRSTPRWSYLFYLQNFLVPHPTGSVGPLGTTWSLAIEEQFYLVWAVVVRFCSYSQLRWSAITVICLSPLVRGFLLLHHVNLYPNVFCRLDGLMAGGLVALGVRAKTFRPVNYLKAAWIGLFLSLALAFVSETLKARWITFSFSSLASAAFVYLALFATQRWFRKVMTNRVLAYTGTISYGLYLLHKLPFDAEQIFRLGRHPVLELLAGLAASYAIATLSWFIFEKPFLKLKSFFEAKPALQEDADGQLAPVAP